MIHGVITLVELFSDRRRAGVLRCRCGGLGRRDTCIERMRLIGSGHGDGTIVRGGARLTIWDWIGSTILKAPPGLRPGRFLSGPVCPFHLFSHGSCQGLLMGGEPCTTFLGGGHGCLDLLTARFSVRLPRLRAAVALDVLALWTLRVEAELLEILLIDPDPPERGRSHGVSSWATVFCRSIEWNTGWISSFTPFVGQPAHIG